MLPAGPISSILLAELVPSKLAGMVVVAPAGKLSITIPRLVFGAILL